MLYIVPTPIGNLGDFTIRAVEVLKTVELVLAEDTRTTGKLFNHYDIKTSLKSFHLNNEHQVLEYFGGMLKAGKDLALVSDAGTPAISDPGFLLARYCREEGIEVTCLPGATAFVPALVVSGLPCDKFYFEGFLPPKKGKQTRIKALEAFPCTTIIYESPHRIVKCLTQLLEFFNPERKASLCRELSKLHEEVLHGTLQEIHDDLSKRQSIKGEIVLVIAGKES